MSGSSYGQIFKLTTFGESHGVAIGGIIEGFPSNFALDLAAVQRALDKRRPGQSGLVSPRNEKDELEILSGLFDGKTTGSPIAFLIKNQDQQSKDYQHLKDTFRPSHADYTYQQKYGNRDHRGGGRSSARETACRVVAGAIASQALQKLGVKASTFVDQIGSIQFQTQDWFSTEQIEASPLRCPDPVLSQKMEALVKEMQQIGDTIGGAIRSVIKGVPAGWGEPVFDKLHAELGKAMLSINAVKGFEIGSGFASIQMKGSAHNDQFLPDGQTVTNYSGGIQGGISNGMPISFRVAFKPVASIAQTQEVLAQDGQLKELGIQGRHDACVVPRAVPIVDAMAHIVLFDFYLRQQRNTLFS
ncbi:MAG: chorismate synthase [Flavobacteriales bacterium]|jgi:chorismate synthase